MKTSTPGIGSTYYAIPNLPRHALPARAALAARYSTLTSFTGLGEYKNVMACELLKRRQKCFD